MKTILAMLQLLPAIVAAVRTVEDLIPLPGQGKTKLDLILGVIEDTGENISGLYPLIVKTINRIVAAANAVGIFKTT